MLVVFEVDEVKILFLLLLHELNLPVFIQLRCSLVGNASSAILVTSDTPLHTNLRRIALNNAKLSAVERVQKKIYFWLFFLPLADGATTVPTV